jgi:hypothetical protein
MCIKMQKAANTTGLPLFDFLSPLENELCNKSTKSLYSAKFF